MAANRPIVHQAMITDGRMVALESSELSIKGFVMIRATGDSWIRQFQRHPQVR